MADYITDYSGDQINEAIGNALNMKDRLLESNIFGSTNLTPNESSDPVDLSNLETPGLYTANKYTNGPDFSANSTTGSTPIQIHVTAHHNDVGTIDRVYQSVSCNGQTAYRYKTAGTTEWGKFINSSDTIRTNGLIQASSGDYVSTYKPESEDIIPADGVHFVMKIPGPNAADPMIMVDTTRYKIRTVTNETVGVGSFGTNSYIEFYFGKDPTNPAELIVFVSGVTNSADKAETDEEIHNIFELVESYGPGVVVNTAVSGARARLRSSTMTMEEADAIHTLTRSDETKSKIAATDSTGKITVTKLTLAEAEKLHNMMDPTSQTSSDSTSLISCADLGTAPIAVDEITAEMVTKA
mgnify:CR=1 FL=1